MAKRGYWTPKRRAAFKKMRAGLDRSRRKTVKRRVKRRRVTVAKRGVAARRTIHVLRNPAYAILANPGGGYGSGSRSKSTMAKRRKRRSKVARRRPIRRRRARSAAITPRRRVRRRRGARRATDRGRARRGVTLYVNPRRKRSRRRLRRHRNPSGLLKKVFTPFAVGFVTSMAAAAIDTTLSNYPRGAQLAKVAGAFAIAFAGRRHPMAANAAISALAASIGYPLGVKAVGGFVAKTPGEAVKGLGDMSRTYPQMGALLSGGMGALLSGMGDAPSNLSTVSSNYQQALNNMADDDD